LFFNNLFAVIDESLETNCINNPSISVSTSFDHDYEFEKVIDEQG